MKELALIEGLNTELAVIDSKKLAKISQRMVEIDRANLTAGKQNTQATSQLMTLTMLCDAPYRRIRQVLAQIEKTRTALEEQAFKLKKDKIRLGRYRESDDELKQVRADEIEHKMYRSKMYVEASLKQLATFQEVYEEIKETHNIPADWDEMDLEKEEISNHIKMAFRNGVRNVMTTGTLNAGTLEYLEQFGIHPVTALHLIKDYLESCDQLKSEDKMPTVDHFYNFLDECAETFKDCHKAVMRRIGIKDLIKDEYIFQEMRDAV